MIFTPRYSIVKLLKTRDKEKNLNSIQRKGENIIIRKGIYPNLSSETMQVMKQWVFYLKKERKEVNLKFYIQQKYPFKMEAKIETFSDKQSCKNLLPADLQYQKC